MTRFWSVAAHATPVGAAAFRKARAIELQAVFSSARAARHAGDERSPREGQSLGKDMGDSLINLAQAAVVSTR